MRRVIVVGAGWSGAVVAHRLTVAGLAVEVLERARVIGGHSRVESLCGVTYEPNGPHILHTTNPDVVALWERLGIDMRPYRFRPLTEIELADGTLRMMSWPIQVDELAALPDWPRIERELAALPERPTGDDFESYVVSMMGRRLYELFIEGYTRKQWGRDPSELSSSFAPRRVELRRDGCRDLFRDDWQFFPADGVNRAIERLVASSAVTCGADVRLTDLADAGRDIAAIVVTAALDELLWQPGTLDWRGVHLRSRYVPASLTGTASEAYVINRPSMRVPYTRTIETKHATGQRICGTVISEEHPGALAKHYPVATVDHRYENANRRLQSEARAALAPVPVFFTGRLASYRYINQDEAIAQASDCANAVLAKLQTKAGA